jgi:Flp pilus assembly protein TadD
MFGGLGRAALGATRDPEKRLVACLRHLAKHPEDKGTWMEFGSSGEDAKQLNAAMYGFKVAAKLDPDDNDSWKRLGSALYRQGKIKEASEAYGQAVGSTRRTRTPSRCARTSPPRARSRCRATRPPSRRAT